MVKKNSYSVRAQFCIIDVDNDIYVGECGLEEIKKSGQVKFGRMYIEESLAWAGSYFINTQNAKESYWSEPDIAKLWPDQTFTRRVPTSFNLSAAESVYSPKVTVHRARWYKISDILFSQIMHKAIEHICSSACDVRDTFDLELVVKNSDVCPPQSNDDFVPRLYRSYT